MIYTYPSYYSEFKCIADKCPDTCCAGWQIVIDDDSLENYENYQGEYRDTLQKRIKWKSGVFRQDKYGNCAFLRQDHLCDMYICMGEESLCKTCKEYPRHTEEFENLREISLSLSCPEVARMFVQLRDKVTFTETEDEEEEFFEDFDYFLFSELQDMRQNMLTCLQNREIPLKNRLQYILELGYTADKMYEDGRLSEWSEWAQNNNHVTKIKPVSFQELNHIFSCLYELELLYPDWENLLMESEYLLFSEGEESLSKHMESFEKWWKESKLLPLEILLEQIMVYFLTTYFLGAVYDERISGKVDACAGHVTEIYLLLLARWIRNENMLDEDDLIDIIYRYSREIEHSDDNLECVEELEWFQRS